MLGVVGEQASLAGGSHVLGTLDHVCSCGIIEDPVRHILHAGGQVKLAAVPSLLALLALPVLQTRQRDK